MDKLEQLIEKFKNDKDWNRENKDGSHRFDNEIAWIEEMIREYAEFFKLSLDEIVEKMEAERTYSWPNYYQPSNFPSPSKFGELVGIYKTLDEFKNYYKDKWDGFKCPKCKSVSSHPQLCVHRLNKDGVCDWCADGLFKAKDKVIIIENGFGTIPIFEPVLKGGKQNGNDK